jgi:hypothetical protein
MLRPAIESTETAVSDTDIGVVDVTVDNERNRVIRMLLLAHTVGRGAKLEEGCVSVEVQNFAHANGE